MSKVELVCSNCGSKNVKRDAFAVWNVETQQWELGTVFDDSTCDDCGYSGNNVVEEREMTEEGEDGG